MRSDLGAMCCSIRLSVFEGQSEKNIIEQNALIEINSHWSNSEYLNRRNLFAAKKSVELTFMFTVTVYNTERKGVVFDAEYSNAMECFYKDKNFADFELIVQGKVLKAHKAILVARSELFSKFIVNQTQQNLSGVGFSKMFIKNYEVEVIEEILRFLYLNKVERLDKLASNLLLAANAVSSCKFK